MVYISKGAEVATQKSLPRSLVSSPHCVQMRGQIALPDKIWSGVCAGWAEQCPGTAWSAALPVVCAVQLGTSSPSPACPLLPNMVPRCGWGDSMVQGLFPLGSVEEMASYSRRKGDMDASQAEDMDWIVFFCMWGLQIFEVDHHKWW